MNHSTAIQIEFERDMDVLVFIGRSRVKCSTSMDIYIPVYKYLSISSMHLQSNGVAANTYFIEKISIKLSPISRFVRK